MRTYPITFTMRTDAELRAAIDAAAAREGSSASEWVRRVLVERAPRPTVSSASHPSCAGAPRALAHG